MFPMMQDSGVAWEFYGNLQCDEFGNETWGRFIPDTGQVFCSQCGSTQHREAE